MRKFICLFILFINMCTVFSQSYEENIIQQEKETHLNKINFVAPQTTSNYDVKYYRLELQINPEVNFIQGKITTYFIPNTSLTKLYFDLSTSLTADSVIYHQQEVAYSQPGADLLEITFPTTINALQLDSVHVYYKGSPTNSAGFGSFIKSTHNNVAIIWTLSEPYGAKDWWPCKQTLSDKADSIDLIVTTPQQYRAAGNGLLVSETNSGGKKTYHWKTRYPIATYLIATAVTNYAQFQNKVVYNNDTLNVLNYVYPEDSANAFIQTTSIASIIRLFDSLLVIYPFQNEKYGHAQFGWGGGMENQTMSFMANFSFELMAHECAHQWFGDKITCGSWQDIWLNEGFATYLQGLTEEFIRPENWNAWKQSKISNITSSPDGSVKCDDTTNVSRIFNGRLTYSKGAYLLHMLRWKLGDVAFFQSLKNYLNDPYLAYQFARTENLKWHFENASGKNLSSFFNQWYIGQGYPTYQIKWSYENDNLSVLINQYTSHNSVSFFEMPVPIRFKNADHDTILIFDHTFSGQLFNRNLDFVPDSAFFDPDRWLISGNNSVAKSNQLELSNEKLHVYPNPSKNSFTIELVNYEKEISSIDLIDEQGKVVWTNNQFRSKKITLQRNNLPNGTYLLRLYSAEEKIGYKKILLQ